MCTHIHHYVVPVACNMIQCISSVTRLGMLPYERAVHMYWQWLCDGKWKENRLYIVILIQSDINKVDTGIGFMYRILLKLFFLYYNVANIAFSGSALNLVKVFFPTW